MKFRVTRDADYVTGHLRYGHQEGIVEVKSEKELLKMIKNGSLEEYLELVVDDYCVDDVDYGNNEFEYEAIE